MNTTIARRFAILVASLVLCVAIAQTTNAQTSYKVSGKPDITLYGTSTLHNWTMSAHAFTCNAQFNVSADNQLNGLSALSFSLPVHNLKSEHDGMNDNAYETLKAKEHKEITFQLTSARVASTGGNKYQVTALGNLTIAGATKAVTLNTAAVVNADGSVSCSGSLPIKLSEFKIERPSFMLGTMSVGDAMTLNYSLIFAK